MSSSSTSGYQGLNHIQSRTTRVDCRWSCMGNMQYRERLTEFPILDLWARVKETVHGGNTRLPQSLATDLSETGY